MNKIYEPKETIPYCPAAVIHEMHLIGNGLEECRKCGIVIRTGRGGYKDIKKKKRGFREPERG
jgi:hypothetical protein